MKIKKIKPGDSLNVQIGDHIVCLDDSTNEGIINVCHKDWVENIMDISYYIFYEPPVRPRIDGSYYTYRNPPYDLPMRRKHFDEIAKQTKKVIAKAEGD